MVAVGPGQAGAHPPIRTTYLEQATSGGNSALAVCYDGRRDRFVVVLASPRPAGSIERNDGVVLRVDPETGELVGIEIYDFRRQFVKVHPEAREAWTAWKRAHSPWRRLVRRLVGGGGEQSLGTVAAQSLERSLYRSALSL